MPDGRRAPGQASDKTFMLGLGAQKAGTTWLYDYLKRSPEFAHGYFKEYHVFDAVDLDWWGQWRDRVNVKAAEALESLKRGEPEHGFQLHRASMVADQRFYFDYFAGLLRSRPRIRVAGDVTPEYALLSEQRLADIRHQFRKRRIRAVAVFLMRDPVDRIWSQIRMQKGREPHRFPEPAEQLVLQRFDSPEFLYERMSRYEDTIGRIDGVFGDDAYYGFYEELFTKAEVMRICDFLGVEAPEPDFERRRNVSEVDASAGLPENVARTVARHLSTTYEAVAARFPDRDLARLWPHARYVG